MNQVSLSPDVVDLIVRLRDSPSVSDDIYFELQAIAFAGGFPLDIIWRATELGVDIDRVLSS